MLRIAMWERVSKAGLPYKNFRLELERHKPVPTEAPVVEETPEESDDGLPW